MPATHSISRRLTAIVVACAALACLAAPAAAQTPAAVRFGEISPVRIDGQTALDIAGADGTRYQVTIARNGSEIARTGILTAEETSQVRYDWDCSDGGSGYSATVTTFDAADAPVAGSEQTVPFSIPEKPCRSRLGLYRLDRKAIRAGRRFEVTVVDYWNDSAPPLRLRVCLITSKKSRCRLIHARERDVTFTAPRTERRVGITLTTNTPGIKFRSRIYRVRKPLPAKPKPTRPAPAPPNCSPSVCHANAVDSARSIARAIYFDDRDATAYGASCRAVTRARFKCNAWVSGIISDLVGEGEAYRCNYGVKVTIRGSKVFATRHEQGIYVTGGPKNCIGVGDG